MAYTDFTVTTFGEAWIAQAVSDAQNGTNKAVLTSVRYAYIDSDDNWTLWKSDSNPLVNNYGNNFSIRSHVDNSGDTASHYFNTIEIMGRTDGQLGPLGTIATCTSTITETIPAFDVEPVTKISTVQFALGSDASITLSANVVPGTLMQDEAVLAWPQITPEAGISTLHTDTIQSVSGSYVSFSEPVDMASNLSVGGTLLASNIGSMVLVIYNSVSQNYNVWQDGQQTANNANKTTAYSSVDTSEFNGAVYGLIGETSASTIAFFNDWSAADNSDTNAKSALYILFQS